MPEVIDTESGGKELWKSSRVILGFIYKSTAPTAREHPAVAPALCDRGLHPHQLPRGSSEKPWKKKRVLIAFLVSISIVPVNQPHRFEVPF